jgi:GTP cyclohydrolase I
MQELGSSSVTRHFLTYGGKVESGYIPDGRIVGHRGVGDC